MMNYLFSGLLTIIHKDPKWTKCLCIIAALLPLCICGFEAQNQEILEQLSLYMVLVTAHKAKRWTLCLCIITALLPF